VRVGVLASVAHRTPPRGYGPWEQVASTIAEGLVARGHEVTLFATADSATGGRLVSAVPTGYEEDRSLDAKVCEYLHDATAFAHRDKALMLTLINAWDDAAEAPRHVAWTEAFWRDIQPRTSGAYVNFLEDEGRDRIREAYPMLTRQRLAAIKGRYDPENLFRGNQNIRPA